MASVFTPTSSRSALRHIAAIHNAVQDRHSPYIFRPYHLSSRTKSRPLLRSDPNGMNLLLYAHAYGKGSFLHAYHP